MTLSCIRCFDIDDVFIVPNVLARDDNDQFLFRVLGTRDRNKMKLTLH